MSREKQTEEKHELSESIYMSGYGLLRQDCDDIAKQLYHEGYRKQSEGEWISVDERLPEIDGKYLAYTTRGTVELARCYSYVNGTPQFDYWITHWMPLPEAPKMKGGAE